MVAVSRETVSTDIIGVITDLTSDWDLDREITEDTLMFNDLGFESIDAVALATAVEEYCGHPLPFAEFLSNLGQRGVRDLRVGELVDFIHKNMNSSTPGTEPYRSDVMDRVKKRMG